LQNFGFGSAVSYKFLCESAAGRSLVVADPSTSLPRQNLIALPLFSNNNSHSHKEKMFQNCWFSRKTVRGFNDQTLSWYITNFAGAPLSNRISFKSCYDQLYFL